MKQHETRSSTGTIQALLRACWQGFRTITMCRRRGVRPAAAGPGRASNRRAEHQQYCKRRRCGGCRWVRRTWPQCWWATAGPGRSAGGRRQGLAGLRTDAPSRRLAARTASGRAAAHRHTQRLSPEVGPTGTRNISGTTRNADNPATYSTGARTRRPAPPDATTQTQLRSTCVQCRSARAARRSRRSSRSPRLRRRAGPRR